MPQPQAKWVSLEQLRSLAVQWVEKHPDAVILIDGRSGSGKSTAAQNLVEAIRAEVGIEAELIRLEDLYAGWGGLAAGVQTLTEVLQARSMGLETGFTVYDWERSEFDGWRELSNQRVWLIEGCGAITDETVEHADVSVWIEVADKLREERVAVREPDYLSWWGNWNAQHEAFLAQQRSPELADLILD